MGKSTYSLEGNGTDLSKLYPSGNTNLGSTGYTSSHYMHVMPNSHFWTDLNQIIYSIEHQLQKMKDEATENTNMVYVGEPLTKEYLLIGLNNSIKNGYKLRIIGKDSGRIVPYIFGDIDGMIAYVKNKEFILKSDFEDFEQTIKNTLECGLNLTNGLKMRREDVYKRLDGERDYQDEKWGTRRTADGTPDEEKPVAEWINYMEFHLAKAKEKVYYLKTEEALAEVRKVTALGVRAMEIHGCPERQKESHGTPLYEVGGEK